jgi:hypothetical protein
MSVTKLTTDLDIIQTLADEPNDVTGLTPTEVKTKFDESGNAIKTYINDTLTVEIDALAASVISVVGIPTLSGTNVQDVLESVKLRIDAIAIANVNAEVANTHTGADARTYTSLSDRLDTIDVTDTAKALQTDLVLSNAAIALNQSEITTIDATTFKKTDWTAGTGWKQLANGLILQWGSGTTNAETQVLTYWYSYGSVIFPKAFPNACLIANVNQNNNVLMWHSTTTSTKTTCIFGFTGGATDTNNKAFTYFSIGY